MERQSSPFEKCTDRARRILRLARALSIQRQQPDILPQDLLEALADDGSVGSVALSKTGYMRPPLPKDLPTVSDKDCEESQMLRRLMQLATIEAKAIGHKYPGSEHQLLALAALHPEVFPDATKTRAEVMRILGIV